VSTVAASPQLSALGLRVLFAPRRGKPGVVLLGDITEAFLLLDQVYAFSSNPEEPPLLPREQRLRVHLISMNSPLELLASIPPAFIAGLAMRESLTNFLAFFERVFNLPLAIKVDRDRLLAESQEYRLEQLEHERDSQEIEGQLDEFERRAAELKLVPEVAEVVEIDEVGSRGLDERMDALKRANDIRTARVKLRKDLKAGRESIHAVLLDPPDYVQTAKVFDMLLAVPMYGRVKANRILNQARISPSKTIGGLSERQRAELVSLLR
jgi:hypothetical protein